MQLMCLFFLLSVKWNEIAQAVKYNVTFEIGLFITSIYPFFITTTLAQREAGVANPSCLGVKAEQVASLLQGHMQKTTIHTGTHSDSQFRVPTVHVFGLLEKAVGPGAKPRGHRKNMNTSHWRPGGSNPWPLCVLRGNSAEHCDTVSPFITYETKYRICMKRE